MATLYAKTAGGNWSAAGTWSNVNAGGIDNSGPPTAGDNVIFELLSGNVTIDSGGTRVCRSINCTSGTGSYTGTLSHDASTILAIGDATAGVGNVALKFSAGMTYTKTDTTSSETDFISTSATKQDVNVAGKSLGHTDFNAASNGSWQFTSAFNSDEALVLTKGTLDANGFNITCAAFSSSNANVRGLTMGSGTWTLTGTGTVWFSSTATSFTLSSGTSTVDCTDSSGSARTFTTTASLVLNNLKISAGSGTLTTTGVSCKSNLDFTGYTGTWGTDGITVNGNLTFGAGMTVSSSANLIILNGTSGTQTITSNNVVVDRAISINGAGGTTQLADNLDMSTRQLTLARGTFNAANKNLSCGIFSSNNSNARVITMGSGTWTLTSTGTVWTTATTTLLTLNPGASTIKLTNASVSTKTFSGGGATFNNLWLTGSGTGNFIFIGSNTFNDLKCDTPPHTLSFTAGTTNTVTTFTVSGTVGNLMTIQSQTAAGHTLAKAGGGVISSDYLSISRSTATPGTTWYAGANSTDGGNNSGWVFTIPPADLIKTMDEVAIASVKTANGVDNASVKTKNGVAN